MAYATGVNRDWLPKEAIYAILNRLQSNLVTTCCIKQRKYENFIAAVRYLSSRSIDPRGGYASFMGLDDNDPTHYAAVYVDNIRGEFDPNFNRHMVYHVAYVSYGDINAINRVLQQRNAVISGNTQDVTGASFIDGTISVKIYNAAPVSGTRTDAQIILPAGANNPNFLPPGVGPSIPGTLNNIQATNINFVG
jgi:hypothetical protein